ncbi:unnamed protein product [Polarella glacialis]|uniref:Polycystin cation channel PKD1/PKD2 domain-containing protein n=1 Tax=Polarella glacialis TaxID=89957 RepID=A0A813H052_POLGL|nr:unnamed protein product [Polarella glacialis]
MPRPMLPMRRQFTFSGAAAEGINWVDTNVHSGRACKSIPFLIMLWCSFVFTQLAHHQVQSAYDLRNTFVDVMDSVVVTRPNPTTVLTSKELGSIQMFEDIYEWLEFSYIPILWTEGPGGRGVVRYLNRFIGGLRITHQRRKLAESCPGHRNRQVLKALYNISCYQQELETGPLAALGPSAPEGDASGTYRYWLDLGQHSSEAIAHLHHLMQNAWTSGATVQESIQGLFYNADLGIFVFTEVRFELLRSGMLMQYKTVRCLPEMVYTGAGANRQKSLISHFLNFYRLATIATIMGGFALAIFFLWLSFQIDDLSAQIEGAPQATGLTTAGYMPGLQHSQEWLDHHLWLDGVIEEIATLAEYLRNAQLAGFWYSLLMLCKFMEGFEANARLATVIKTFRFARSDLLHFFVLFGLVFINFSLGAYFLFGQQLKVWSSMTMSMSSSFRTLMGDFDFMSIYSIAPISATVWFWLYMIGIYLVLLNVFVAIIMDAYQQVRHSAIKQQGLGDQFAAFATKMSRSMLGAEKADKLLREVLGEKNPQTLQAEKEDEEEEEEEAAEKSSRPSPPTTAETLQEDADAHAVSEFHARRWEKEKHASCNATKAPSLVLATHAGRDEIRIPFVPDNECEPDFGASSRHPAPPPAHAVVFDVNGVPTLPGPATAILVQKPTFPRSASSEVSVLRGTVVRTIRKAPPH